MKTAWIGGLGGAVAASGGAPAWAAGLSGPSLPPASATELLRSEPLINQGRAYDVMTQEGLDGIIVTHDPNVYYMTNFWPLQGKMGYPNTCAGLIANDPKRDMALVIPTFTYYYIYQEWGITVPRELFLYNAPADIDAYLAQGTDRLTGPEPEVGAGRPFSVIDNDLVSTFEEGRYSGLEAAQEKHGLSAGIEWGIVKAARELGLKGGRIAVDDPMIARALSLAGIQAEFVPAENILRKIRLQRSPAEIALLRIAAQQNAEAGLAACQAVQPGMTHRELRALFYAEAALRGHTPVFMVIDRVSSELHEAELRRGQAVLVDCVSHFMHYHGDWGRTVFIGEPPGRMAEATKAMAFGWNAVREQLRPGLKFSEISRLGNEAIKKQGWDYRVAFGPHSVGLFHGDQPGRDDAPFTVRADLELQEGMVLSVDCPLMNDGVGGSGHLEDLTLITKDGWETLNDPGNQVITV